MAGLPQRRRAASLALSCLVVAAAGCGGSGTHTQAVSSAEQAKLRQLAQSGGPLMRGRPTDIQVVKTTYAQYQKVLGGPPVGGAGEVYVIGMKTNVTVPGGHSFPYLVLIVDAKTNKRLVALPSQAPPQLSRLGPVTKL